MPIDPTPHGGEALHRPPDRVKIPQPKPGQAIDAPVRGQLGDDTDALDATDISERPGLPERPQLMAADIEDEDADPVIDSGPGIDDDDTGKPSVTQQPA